MAKLIVSDLDVKDKKVLIRVDFNVPIKGGVIGDDNRIVAALPTIKYVVENGGKAILLSHLGRIKSDEDKKELSLQPVATRLAELLNQPVTFVPVNEGKKLEDAVNAMTAGQVLVMENTRFQDIDNDFGKRESKNDPKLGEYWASLGDVFVNDAFGTAHRAHASNVGIATAMKAKGQKVAAGFLMEKEIKFLGDAVDNPKHPFVAILGGAKVSDKIGVIDHLLSKADKVIVGGGMTYTFYAAKGLSIGKSLVETDKIDLAKQIIDKAGDKLVLPIDNIVAKEFNNDVPSKDVEGNIPDGYMALDIGEKSIAEFKDVLKDAKTVVWNGPMGVFEMSNYAKGTLEIGKFLGTLTDATTIVGGGDSTAAVKQLGVGDQLTHISTGGGASLEYLEGKELPGIAAISNK
ncbi:phosphoglycerate kinase [Loigolactobacillus coryniformis subsp. coryniformis]|jgi:phosphoglycerate kinase|uniref:Phosphoglycerate kinase n=2 Tax=Loigolactobacillus coryniformis TaxID=1610 RepID=J3JAY7_9LACO|nr:phosphoglycerate kinase [Loigolactobacillus coryniformis]MDT3390822.1 phosphoglycerate kinase [Bacillota bacterium]ATO44347.1 phosphoglycerate kinase [Loigolactobacillus coryniformis subsp. torquens DSM 20004 = KCTC 3535]EJN55259.1 Phosphoglycerate kinase [Loigolactobacillus coryniformis subsp. coryniformis CECT 5711]KRK85195.1 phosphoglycerate kinase [Loigolactobacillus coryniformis subsp. torquens DSM 20004 = KCTC 3535]MBW4803063.1 phosphoglycerate kinase [Loigolactobacillus coryniformis 